MCTLGHSFPVLGQDKVNFCKSAAGEKMSQDNIFLSQVRTRTISANRAAGGNVLGQYFPVLGQHFPVPGHYFPVPGHYFPVPGHYFPVLGHYFPDLGSVFFLSWVIYFLSFFLIILFSWHQKLKRIPYVLMPVNFTRQIPYVQRPGIRTRQIPYVLRPGKSQGNPLCFKASFIKCLLFKIAS